MSSHTPTPYTQHNADYCPLEIWGDFDGPLEDGEIHGLMVCEATTEANAKFIVRACNNFDDMLAALKESDKVIQFMVKLSGSGFEEPPSPATKEDADAATFCAHLQQIIATAEAK